jgi:hypothetical protein
MVDSVEIAEAIVAAMNYAQPPVPKFARVLTPEGEEPEMSETLDDLLVRLERAPWSCGVEEGHVLVAEVRRLRDRIAVLDRDGGQTDEAIRLGYYTDEDADNAPRRQDREAK